MKLVQIKLLVVLSVLLTHSFNAKSQTSWYFVEDSLLNSLKVLIESIDADSVYKEKHYLPFDGYDYFASINSLKLAHEVNDVISRINVPFKEDQLVEITFVKCYDWTEANDKWFITLVDNAGNHHIYFYETGMKKPDKYGVRKGGDYFYRLANNLFSNGKCEDKNEDYVITGKIIESKFVAFFSSQTYHRMDIIFFNDLLRVISD